MYPTSCILASLECCVAAFPALATVRAAPTTPISGLGEENSPILAVLGGAEAYCEWHRDRAGSTKAYHGAGGRKGGADGRMGVHG